MRVPRAIIVAGVTAATAWTLTNAVLPSSNDRSDPVKNQTRSEQQWSENRKRELENMRKGASEAADADRIQSLKSREVRSAEKDAAATLRRFIRKP